jgi:ferredoxin-NADP reductase
MTLTGFTGPYTLPADVEGRTDHLVHVVAGSGAVPNFAILKHALHQGLKLRHTFVCSNRTVADICFRRELDLLARQFPERVRVIHTVTREPDPANLGPGMRAGRVTAELLREAVGDASACLVYVCGPAITVWDRQAARAAGTTPEPRFLEAVLAQLEAIGVPESRIKRESYG